MFGLVTLTFFIIVQKGEINDPEKRQFIWINQLQTLVLSATKSNRSPVSPCKRSIIACNSSVDINLVSGDLTSFVGLIATDTNPFAPNVRANSVSSSISLRL